MRDFRCPSCDAYAITPWQKWRSSSFSPAVCPRCRAQVYASGRQSSAWRTFESLLVTLVVIRALLGFSWWLVAVAAVIVIVMEGLRLYLVPLVRLEHAGGGFA